MDVHDNCKSSGISKPILTTYAQKQDTLYIIEHETSPIAKETVYEKIRRIILRESVQNYNGKLRGFIVPLDCLFDILFAICKYIHNAWRLSKGGKNEKTISQ